MEYNLCGKIIATHGIKGALKINNYSDFNRFDKGNFIFLKINDNYQKFKIESCSNYKNGYLITLEGLNDINLVEKYLHLDIYCLPRENDLLEDEYYYKDLIGKEIYNENNKFISIVKNIEEFPQGDMLVITYNSKLKYIPFNNYFIKEVTKDKIIINEIDGLLE